VDKRRPNLGPAGVDENSLFDTMLFHKVIAPGFDLVLEGNESFCPIRFISFYVMLIDLPEGNRIQ
jgi:hypothetical protein